MPCDYSDIFSQIYPSCTLLLQLRLILQRIVIRHRKVWVTLYLPANCSAVALLRDGLW
jgi:hypothetical protein